MALKMRGSLSSSALGKELGITGEAARQHLTKLCAEGLVEAQSVSTGVGRPTQLWALTAAAQSRFPDTHAALTVQLLDIIRATLGDQALDAVINQRELVTSHAYDQALQGRATLGDRVTALTELRSAEGYMASWSQQDDGSILLIENHCPICAAATACQGFCRSELDVFRAVLGEDVTVERLEHIVSGGRRCSYSIRPTTHDTV